MNFPYLNCLVRLSTALVITVILISGAASATELDFSGSIATENRLFFEKTDNDFQISTIQPSFEFEPELSWNKDDISLYIAPFARLDLADSERSHIDFREAYLGLSEGDLSIRAGQVLVFWGVAESRHLVDVINQWDAREDIDSENKLGQLAFELIYQSAWGDISTYLMPKFHDRPHPGQKARLRPGFLIDDQLSQFSGDKTSLGRPDLALRYSHYINDWDVGVSLFHGFDRNPRFEFSEENVMPVYDKITQFGVDLQLTLEAWLWKLEALYKDSPMDSHLAAVAGFEYTFYTLAGSNADLGILVEYQYDGRSSDISISPPVIENNDIFTGFRIALNDTDDTNIIAGIVSDVKNGSLYSSIEASRRLTESWNIEIEGRLFIETKDDPFLNFFRRDSNLTMRIKRHF